jgi:signal peptidase II
MTDHGATPRSLPRWAALLVMAGVIAADQLTKHEAARLLLEGDRHSYLGDVLRLELARNPGAFLGLGARLPQAVRTGVFTWGVAALVLWTLWIALVRRPALLHALGAGLVAAGGIGNLWDRLVAGGLVIDFLNFGIGPLRTGIFNVADLAIVAGVVLLALPVRPSTSSG